MSKNDLRELLQQKKTEGEQLLKRAHSATSQEEVDDVLTEVRAWDKAVKVLGQQANLEELFKINYQYQVLVLASPGPSIGWDEHRNALVRDLSKRLREIEQAISILPAATPNRSSDFNPDSKTSGRKSEAADSKRVFLVHGHDEAARERVARFLEKAGLEVVILHEQPNAGKTLIEKLEDNTGVGYAVVLLTADDEGRARGDEALRPRARQNVVFEAGYLMGRLGRDRVALLYEPEVELPSDIKGVVYIEADPHGAWKEKLFKELRAAGLRVSENKWLGS